MDNEMDLLVYISDTIKLSELNMMRKGAWVFYLKKESIQKSLYFNAVDDEEKGLKFMEDTIRNVSKFTKTTTKFNVKGFCIDTISKVKDLNVISRMFQPKEIRNVAVVSADNGNPIDASFPFVQVYRNSPSDVYDAYDLFNSTKFGVDLYTRHLKLNQEQFKTLHGFIHGEYDPEILETRSIDIHSMKLYQSAKYTGGTKDDIIYMNVLKDYVNWISKGNKFPRLEDTK